MSNIIIDNKAKFWIHDGVIFCEFIPAKYSNVFSKEFFHNYLNAIHTLSKGGYFPLLVDLRRLSDNIVYPIIKFLCKSPELKSVILSKSFVVSSNSMQFGLIALRMAQDPVIPNKIYRSYDKAVKYSLKTNNFFNH